MGSMNETSGVLNIHKPAGMTSRDVVDVIGKALRQHFGQPVKCGHAGTLDPQATGVLLVCTGRATRLVSILQEYPKTYLAEFTLGVQSDTDDSTGIVVAVPGSVPPPRHELQAVLESRVGTILQTPPAFSAVKISGRRAYKLARAGQDVVISPRPVTIYRMQLLEYDYPRLTVTIECGSGTYIRSIARDLGERLGCGGLMHRLERTRIGPYSLRDALAIETAVRGIDRHLQSPTTVFSDEARFVPTDDQLQRLRDGKPLTVCGHAEDRMVAIDRKGRFLALLQRLPTGSQYRPVINWVPAMLAGQPAGDPSNRPSD